MELYIGISQTRLNPTGFTTRPLQMQHELALLTLKREPPELDLAEANIRIDNLERELEHVYIDDRQRVLDMEVLRDHNNQLQGHLFVNSVLGLACNDADLSGMHAVLDALYPVHHGELPTFEFENGMILADDVRNLINYRPPPTEDSIYYLRALLEDIRYVYEDDNNISQRRVLLSHGLLALGSIIDDIIQGLEDNDYSILMEYILTALQKTPPIGLGRPA